MKKIVLKMNDLNMVTSRYGKLEHASFHALEGEVTGLMGLNDSGKELAVRMILGEAEIDWKQEQIFVDDKKIRRAADMKNLVYHITASSEGIACWTVAEYVGLMDVSWFLSKRTRQILRAEVEEQFQELGIRMDIGRKMRELSELERRIVEIVRARKIGARILVIEDECEGMSGEAIGTYRRILCRAIRGRMTAILLCHSETAASILSDCYVIFRKGRVVKKWRKDAAHPQESISDYLLGNTMIMKKKLLDSYARKMHGGENVVYGIRNLKFRETEENFDFKGGEITTFVVLNNTERNRLFLALSGRSTEPETGYILNNRVVYAPGFSDFIKNKIVSVMKSGNDFEIFEKMSVGDNLILPSLKKIPRRDYFAFSGRITRILCRELDQEDLHSRTVIKHLTINDHISISLGRWFVFNPRAIILYEPFTSCDAYGISIIMSYIKKFSNRGTAVIVVKSNSEYMEDISDRIFNFA